MNFTPTREGPRINDEISSMRVRLVDERGQMVGVVGRSEALDMATERRRTAVLDGEQRLKLARIQSFLAIAEGFGDHLTHTLGKQMFSSYPQIDEAMRRYREDEPTDPVFARLLGIEFTREHAALGRGFCDTVAEQSSEAALAGCCTGVADTACAGFCGAEAIVIVRPSLLKLANNGALLLTAISAAPLLSR